MNKYSLLLFCLLICSQVCGQQDTQYSLFMFNKLVYNPGYAGSAGHPSLTAIHRSQWVGLEGAPVSQVLNFHTPFKSERVGGGLSISHEKIGPTRSIFLALSYAYRIKLDKGTIGLGLQGALRHYRVDWGKTIVTHQGDELVNSSENSKLLPNVGVGVYYEMEKFYVGASVPHLIKGDISLLTNEVASTDIQSIEQIHGYLMAGFIFDINKEIKFKPACLIKYVKNAPFEMDINGSFLFMDKIWLGLSYRLGGSTKQGIGESLDIIAQYHVNNAIQLGVAYDITLSELAEYNKGSYELLVQYNIINGRSRFTNPRFF